MYMNVVKDLRFSGMLHSVFW